MRVYYPNPPEGVIDRLQAAVDSGIQLHTGEKLDDFEVLIDGRPPEDLVTVPSLHTLIIPYAGVAPATLELLLKFPHISGHNLHHNAADTAEVAIALLYAAAKRIIPIDARLRRDDWGSRDEDAKAVALEGKTALVLGYGEIGRRIARVLQASGLRVFVLRRSARGETVDGVEMHSISLLREFLPMANVLMLALPLTAETTGLIGEEELALMPKGAILVNIARGPIVNEEALYKALKTNHLHSAGLDVWYHYPEAPQETPGYFRAPRNYPPTPPSDFPFADLENVVMSPHRGGTSMDTESRRVAALTKMLNAAAQGAPVDHKVNLNTGY